MNPLPPRPAAAGEIDFSQTVVNLVSDMTLFGRFKTKRVLGKGGMGVVWLATDTKLNRDIALKFMPEVVATDTASLGDLRRETRNGLLLSHPNIVRMLDLVEDGPSAAIVMEFVDGKTLNDLRSEQPELVFQVSSISGWVQQLINALEYAHSQPKMVHRDLKPHNLMINKEDQLKVADFGIASCVRDSFSRVSLQANNTAGTLVYMSPQQLMGEVPTFSDDIYAFGATLFELLTGRPPFYAGDIPKQIETKIPPRIAQRRTEFGVEGEAVPEAWETLIAACLEKDSADRPASMAEVRKALNGQVFKRGSGTAARRGAAPAVPAAKSGEAAAHAPLLPAWWPYAAGLVVLAYAGWHYGIEEPARINKETARSEQREQGARKEADRKAAREELAKHEEAYAATERMMPLQDSAQRKLVLWKKLLPTIEAFEYPFGKDADNLRLKVSHQIDDYKEQVRFEQDDYDKSVELLKGGIAKAEEISKDSTKGAEPKRKMWQTMLDGWPDDYLKADYGRQHETLRAKIASEVEHWAEAAARESPNVAIDGQNVWLGSPVMTWKDFGRKATLTKVEQALIAAEALPATAKADGEIDPATAQAIKAYQQKNELPVSGRLASVTLQKMGIDFTNEPLPPPAPKVVTSNGGGGKSSGGGGGSKSSGYEGQDNARRWIQTFAPLMR